MNLCSRDIPHPVVQRSTICASTGRQQKMKRGCGLAMAEAQRRCCHEHEKMTVFQGAVSYVLPERTVRLYTLVLQEVDRNLSNSVCSNRRRLLLSVMVGRATFSEPQFCDGSSENSGRSHAGKRFLAVASSCSTMLRPFEQPETSPVAEVLSPQTFS